MIVGFSGILSFLKHKRNQSQYIPFGLNNAWSEYEYFCDGAAVKQQERTYNSFLYDSVVREKLDPVVWWILGLKKVYKTVIKAIEAPSRTRRNCSS